MSLVLPYSEPRQVPESNLFDFRSRRRVSDEESPPYDVGATDAEPPTVTPEPPRQRTHVTMIDDCVVEAVVAKCGMTGAGLYLILERRVGKDGCWTSTVADLATAFGCSVRHVRDTAASLEREGFLERSEVTAYGGATIGVRWFLPRHLRTYGAEPTPEPTPELSCARVIERVVISSSEVDTSKGDTPLTPQEGETPTELEKPSKEPTYPEAMVAYWNAYDAKGRERSSRSQVLAEWKRLKPTPVTVAEIMAGVEAWNASRSFQGGFAPGAHRFLKLRKWTERPAPTEPPPTNGVYSPNGTNRQEQARNSLDRVLQIARGER